MVVSSHIPFPPLILLVIILKVGTLQFLHYINLLAEIVQNLQAA